MFFNSNNVATFFHFFILKHIKLLLVYVSKEQHKNKLDLHLDGHDLTAGFMHHVVDRPIGSSPNFPQILKVLSREVTMLLWRNLQLS